MKLQNAYICIDCDEVFSPKEQGGRAQCPSCTSMSCAPISGWITSWSAFDRIVGRPATVPEEVELIADMAAAVGM